MLKQVIIIRTDLDMRKGKMCGQVAHAAIGAFYKSMTHGTIDQKRMASKWLDDIQTKVVCRVSSEEELEALAKRADNVGIITARIQDAGHTQLEPGTYTCVGLGPDEEEKLDTVTGHLKLL